MKTFRTLGCLAIPVLAGLLATATTATGQGPRADVIWARSTDGSSITLDGIMNEPAWAAAESVTIKYGINAGIPGSGWKVEGGLPLKDSTVAVLKFLTVGNVLYIGAAVQDSSVGGSWDFNRFDGFLMGVKDPSNLSRPAPISEYFYAWWAPEDTCCHTAPGKEPNFFGRWATFPPYLNPRTAEQIDAFDAETVVHGLSNSDAVIDQGYTTEMKINLDNLGYDITVPEGDIVEWNVSIYDCDWLWPLQPNRLGYNRVWWQDPWGNVSWYNEVRVHCRPDVHVASGPVPFIEPELRIPNGVGYASPVIDGDLSDAIWSVVPSIEIRYGDDALRESYPGVGKYRGGQFQPTVNGALNFVEDPGDGRFYYFFQEDSLFLGFDVNDLFVGDHPLEDRMDGFIVTIVDRGATEFDHNLARRRLQFRVGAGGTVVTEGYLPLLEGLDGARVAIDLKPATTVDTTGADFDQGYTAELVLDLTKLGYPSGLGDGALFLGVDLYDGDTFTDPSLSYATRTWWFRESDLWCCPAWAYLDPLLTLVGVEETTPGSIGFALLGNHPNPTPGGSLIRFVVPEPALGTFELYDARGRLIARRPMGLLAACPGAYGWEGSGGSGVYFYRLRFSDPKSGVQRAVLSGKLTTIR